jgi:hypothetical protein
MPPLKTTKKFEEFGSVSVAEQACFREESGELAIVSPMRACAFAVREKTRHDGRAETQLSILPTL